MLDSLFRPGWLIVVGALLSLTAGGAPAGAEELAALLIENQSDEPVSVRVVTHHRGKPGLGEWIEMPGGTTERELGYVPAHSTRLFTGVLAEGDNVVYAQSQGKHDINPEKAYTVKVDAAVSTKHPAAIGNRVYRERISNADLGIKDPDAGPSPRMPGTPDLAAAKAVVGEMRKVHAEAESQHRRLDCAMAGHDVDGLYAQAEALKEEIEALHARLPEGSEQRAQEIETTRQRLEEQATRIDNFRSTALEHTSQAKTAADEVCQRSRSIAHASEGEENTRALQDLETMTKKAQEASDATANVKDDFDAAVAALRGEFAALRQLIAEESTGGRQAGEALKPKITEFRRRWAELDARGRQAAAVANENLRIEGILKNLGQVTSKLRKEVARILSGGADSIAFGFVPPAEGKATWDEASRLFTDLWKKGGRAESCVTGGTGFATNSRRARDFATQFSAVPGSIDLLEQAALAGHTIGPEYAISDKEDATIELVETDHAPKIADAVESARNAATRAEECLIKARKSDEEHQREAIARNVECAERAMQQCNWTFIHKCIISLPLGSSERQRLAADAKRLGATEESARAKMQSAVGQEDAGQFDAALETLRAAQTEPACATTMAEIAAAIGRVEGKIAQACAWARNDLAVAMARIDGLKTRLGTQETEMQGRQPAGTGASVPAQARVLAAEAYAAAGQVVEAKQEAEAAERQACDTAAGAVVAARALDQVDALGKFAADAAARSAAAARKVAALREAARRVDAGEPEIVSALDTIEADADGIENTLAQAEGSVGTACAAEIRSRTASLRASLATLDPRVEALRTLAAPSDKASMETAAIDDAEAEARASADTAEVFVTHIGVIAARTLACRDTAAAAARTAPPAGTAAAGTACPDDMVQARDGSCVGRTDSATAIQMHGATQGQRPKTPDTSATSNYGPRPGRVSGKEMLTGMRDATAMGWGESSDGGGGWGAGGTSGSSTPTRPGTGTGSTPPTGGSAGGAGQAGVPKPSSCQPQPSWIARNTGAPRATHALETGSGARYVLVNEGGRLWQTDGTRYLIQSGSGYNYFQCGDHIATLRRTHPPTRLRDGTTLELGDMTFPKEPGKLDGWRLISP